MILRIYTIADLATLQEWLVEAMAARRQVAIGGKVTSVSYEGKSVSYSPGNLDLLNQWITDLLDTIAWLQGNTTRKLRPIYGAF